MTRLAAILSFVQGVEIYRRRAAGQLAGSPFLLRLQYLGGHPGIWDPAPLWVGRVGDRLRLVDEQGFRYYDLPIDRIRDISCEADQVELRFEPTAGLVTTITFTAADAPDCFSKLRHMVAVSA